MIALLLLTLMSWTPTEITSTSDNTVGGAHVHLETVGAFGSYSWAIPEPSGRNNDRYIFLKFWDGDTAQNSIEVWKAGSRGTGSWAEQDGSNRLTAGTDIPGGANSDRFWIAPGNRFIDGTLIWIAYGDASNNIRVVSFDMASDRWGARSAAGPAGWSDTSGTPQTSSHPRVLQRTAGVLTIVWDSVPNVSTTNPTLNWCDYTIGTDTWGITNSSTPTPGGGFGDGANKLIAAGVDHLGYIHLIEEYFTVWQQFVISPGDSFSAGGVTPGNIRSSGYYTNNKPGTPLGFTGDDEISIGFPGSAYVRYSRYVGTLDPTTRIATWSRINSAATWSNTWDNALIAGGVWVPGTAYMNAVQMGTGVYGLGLTATDGATLLSGGEQYVSPDPWNLQLGNSSPVSSYVASGRIGILWLETYSSLSFIHNRLLYYETDEIAPTGGSVSAPVTGAQITATCGTLSASGTANVSANATGVQITATAGDLVPVGTVGYYNFAYVGIGSVSAN